MASITFRRERNVHHVDGTITPGFIEEKKFWPLMTCRNFERKHPKNVIKVDPYDQPQSSDGRSSGRSFSRDKFYSKPDSKRPAAKPSTKKLTTPAPASTKGLTTESIISEEAKKV